MPAIADDHVLHHFVNRPGIDADAPDRHALAAPRAMLIDLQRVARLHDENLFEARVPQMLRKARMLVHLSVLAVNVALIWGPDGGVLASAQTERVQEEMIVAELDPMLLARERSLSNYALRTRRPELFGELVRDQVSS
jgi:hypothetical protein